MQRSRIERVTAGIRRRLRGPLTAALGAILLSCSDEPTALNTLITKFTDVDIEVVVDTLEAASASTFRQYLPMNGAYNLLGRSGGHEARMALQFTQSQFPQRDTIQVLSAQLRLRAENWFGDSTGTLAFTVHKMLKGWAPLQLIWDSLSTGLYEESVVRGSFSGAITSDTGYVVVDLDTALVREWLRPNDVTQYGVMLVPTSASTSIRGFTAYGTDSVRFDPALTVIAQNLAGTVRDTTIYRLAIDTFVGNIDNLASDPGRIYVQAGVVYRSTLLFDASTIPVGAIVNKADLELVIDRASSNINKFSADTLVAAHVRTSSTDTTKFELAGSIARPGSGDRIRIDIRHAAQLWVNGTNRGLLLRASTSNEFSSLDLFTFHGPASAEVSNRPIVRVVYSIEKEIR